jgi:hypothetical protein
VCPGVRQQDEGSCIAVAAIATAMGGRVSGYETSPGGRGCLVDSWPLAVACTLHRRHHPIGTGACESMPWPVHTLRQATGHSLARDRLAVQPSWKPSGHGCCSLARWQGMRRLRLYRRGVTAGAWPRLWHGMGHSPPLPRRTAATRSSHRLLGIASGSPTPSGVVSAAAAAACRSGPTGGQGAWRTAPAMRR